jgi:hypothetical protein
MLKIGQVMQSLEKKGSVYIEDVYEDRAVRLVDLGNTIEAYIKRKGCCEIKSLYSTDSVQETIHELHNREMTSEEYENF